MNLLPLLKPGLCVTAVGGTVIAGGSLGIYKPKGNEASRNNALAQQEDGELVETNPLIAAPILTQAEKHSFAILVQDAEFNRLEPSGNKRRIKCKLERGSREEWCSLAKVFKNANADKNWINLTELKANGFNGLIDDDFITKESAIYRVRFSETLLLEWQSDTSKKINIFREDEITEQTKPLISLVPHFAFKTEQKIRGPVKYMLVKATLVTKAPADSDATNIKAGESFKCEMPIKLANGTTSYKACEIYKFDQEPSTDGPYANKNLKLPLTKANKFVNNSHYLIKLNEPEMVNHSSYDAGQLAIKAAVYTNPELTTLATTGITEINFEYISPTFVFERNGSIDLVVIPK